MEQIGTDTDKNNFLLKAPRKATDATYRSPLYPNYFPLLGISITKTLQSKLQVYMVAQKQTSLLPLCLINFQLLKLLIRKNWCLP